MGLGAGRSVAGRSDVLQLLQQGIDQSQPNSPSASDCQAALQMLA